MGRKYAIRDQQAVHFVTFTVVAWMDVFIRNEYKQIVMDSLKYCQEHKELNIHAYCIMTSHVHLILSTNHPIFLSDAIRDIKSFTSSQIRKAIENNPKESRKEWMLNMMKHTGEWNKRNDQYQFWQQHNHPIQLSTNDIIVQRLDYVHMNPVVAGFVDEPRHWIWSSCIDYQTEETGKIEIDFL